MRTEMVQDSPAPFVLQHPPTPETSATGVGQCALPATSPEPALEDNTPLLVLALEEIEARRSAIEWLVDANLLRLCLV
jgi:hypothetical protein